MDAVVLITGLNTIFDEKLAAAFAREGFRVLALGDKPVENVTLLPLDVYAAAAEMKKQIGKLDFLLDTTDVRHPRDTGTARNGIDYAVVESVYRQNVLRSMAALEAFLPLLDKGSGKRLFYLTSAGASINETRSIDNYGYNMSKAALHQFLQMTRNKLAPRGYTFRVFDPLGESTPLPGQPLSPECAAEGAYHYITRRRGAENDDPQRDDEDNLVFRDALGRQHSW